MYVTPAPTLNDVYARVGRNAERFSRAVAVREEGSAYPHWDKLRHLEPPAGLDHEEWWLGIKLARASNRRPVPLTDANGEPFSFTLPDTVLRRLHYIDQHCSGEIAMPEVVTADDQARKHYLVNSLMEEAIRSSQLEGATTSRRVAKELLRSNRPPRDRSERMIVNNYLAMQFMREEMGERLTPEAVLQLQRILTEGTMDDPDASGRLQRPDEHRVAVVDRETGSLLHQPPPAAQLPERLQAMCDFANVRDDGDVFVHPVIRAITLHFWLAYDHPFEDGNGRTARVLFTWFMRTRGYWLAEYLAISKILRQAPSKYNRAFLLTETDERDLTYFVLHQLDVIERAIGEFRRYLQSKVKEVRKVEKLVRGSADFNHRQLALISDALRHPDRTYTFGEHAARHTVTHETARADLRELAERGVLEVQPAGRKYLFHPVPNLADLLSELGTVDPADEGRRA